MRALLSALLLSSLLQLCGAAALSCSRFHNLTASDLAVQHINQHHRHGYKFSLDDVSEAQLERVAGGCRIQLQLRLKETTCPVADPRELQECGSRMMGERAVVANCSVLITVKDDNAAVSRYDCQTRQEMTDREMMGMCPDCPKLLPLDDPKGLEAIQEAITEFNKNASNQRVFVLWEVGRISVGFVSSTGMNYYSEFLLVETPCPSQSRILHRACRPLCAHRARHAFCRSSYSQMKGLHLPLRCEFFPPKNTTGLGPGEKEPPCPPHLPHGPPGTPHIHGPPPHAHGPPPHAHGPPTDAQGPPPHAHGPPPHAHGPPPHAHGPPPHAHGPPPHAHGPPTDAQRPPPHAHGPPTDAQRPPPHAHGPPTDAQRPPPHAHGPPPHAHGPPTDAQGPPPHAHGPPTDAQGPPPHAHGPPTDAQRPPPHAHGPPTDAQRPPPHAHGPPTDAQRPPPHAHGPPTDAQRPPPHAHGPPTDAQRPPPHAHGPPTDAQRPPPHAHGRHPHFPRPSHCPGPLAAADPAIHPICPWPRPARPQPRGD